MFHFLTYKRILSISLYDNLGYFPSPLLRFKSGYPIFWIWLDRRSDSSGRWLSAGLGCPELPSIGCGVAAKQQLDSMAVTASLIRIADCRRIQLETKRLVGSFTHSLWFLFFFFSSSVPSVPNMKKVRLKAIIFPILSILSALLPCCNPVAHGLITLFLSLCPSPQCDCSYWKVW